MIEGIWASEAFLKIRPSPIRITCCRLYLNEKLLLYLNFYTFFSLLHGLDLPQLIQYSFLFLHVELIDVNRQVDSWDTYSIIRNDEAGNITPIFKVLKDK